MGLTGVLQVAGTPLENGNFTANLQFHDSATPTNNVLTRQLNVNINTATQPGITIFNNSNIGTYSQGSALNFQLFACCVTNYIWSVVTAGLPNGVSTSLAAWHHLLG